MAVSNLRRVYFHREENSGGRLIRRMCCIAEVMASPARASRSLRWRDEAALSARWRIRLPDLMSLALLPVRRGEYRTRSQKRSRVITLCVRP